MTEITPWHWAGFIVCILFLIALDLGALSRQPKARGFKAAAGWSAVWLALAFFFAAGLNVWRGRSDAVQFVSGYLMELSLSLDNVLVIALIFSAFHVPPSMQHRVLFYGVLGALVMRGLMIGLGVALIHRFNWVLYVFGAFLVFTGVKMVFSRRPVINPEKNLMLRLVRRCFPVAPDFVGDKFLTVINQRRALTPLALVLLTVESCDVLFAFDSVPAVFSVTRDAFLVFTSNVLAILGLRSLYFLLAGALEYFRYLKFGLSAVLVFVGGKMLLEPHGARTQWFQCNIPNGVSLLVMGAILGAAMAVSVIVARRHRGVAS